MPDCTALQAQYDEIDAAVRALITGKRRSMVKEGENEVQYANVSLAAMQTERQRLADQLRTQCSINVGGSGSRVLTPDIGRTW